MVKDQIVCSSGHG